MIHIGNIIKQELEKQERTIVWLAKKLKCDHSNIYSIFRRESMDTDLLLRISIALNVNFFQYYVHEYEENM